MGQNASVQIYNDTRKPIIYVLSQVAPLYWGILQPKERKTIITGRVYWTVEVGYYVSDSQLPTNAGSAVKVLGASAAFVFLPVIAVIPLGTSMRMVRVTLSNVLHLRTLVAHWAGSSHIKSWHRRTQSPCKWKVDNGARRRFRARLEDGN